jgi:hypothetical protein
MNLLRNGSIDHTHAAMAKSRMDSLEFLLLSFPTYFWNCERHLRLVDLYAPGGIFAKEPPSRFTGVDAGVKHGHISDGELPIPQRALGVMTPRTAAVQRPTVSSAKWT